MFRDFEVVDVREWMVEENGGWGGRELNISMSDLLLTDCLPLLTVTVRRLAVCVCSCTYLGKSGVYVDLGKKREQVIPGVELSDVGPLVEVGQCDPRLHRLSVAVVVGVEEKGTRALAVVTMMMITKDNNNNDKEHTRISKQSYKKKKVTFK